MPLVSIELGFSRVPSSSDDRSKGYMESWLWEDQSTNKLYKCIVDTIGNAQWVEVGSGSSGLAVVCIPCDRMKGGTAPAYQSVAVGYYPYIVKKFLNATTNTAYFDICLPQIKAGTTVRYRVRYMITESTTPTLNQTTIFTGATGVTVTKTYAGTETQNTIIITDWTGTGTQTTTGLLTVTGTYAQNIGILSIDVEYTKG